MHWRSKLKCLGFIWMLIVSVRTLSLLKENWTKTKRLPNTKPAKVWPLVWKLSYWWYCLCYCWRDFLFSLKFCLIWAWKYNVSMMKDVFSERPKFEWKQTDQWTFSKTFDTADFLLCSEQYARQSMCNKNSFFWGQPQENKRVFLNPESSRGIGCPQKERRTTRAESRTIYTVLVAKAAQTKGEPETSFYFTILLCHCDTCGENLTYTQRVVLW